MMTYNNGTCALQFPSHYVPVTEEKMTYVDGGKFYGVSISASDCNRIAKAWNGLAFTASIAGFVCDIVSLCLPGVGIAVVAAGIVFSASGIALTLGASWWSYAASRNGAHIGYNSTTRRFSCGYGQG